MLYNSCLVALRVARKSALGADPLAESFLRGCDLSQCAGRILCVVVTSFRGELYGGFMSAPRRGQVVKSFLNAHTVGRGYVSARLTREREKRESAGTRRREIETKAREWSPRLKAQGTDGSKKGTLRELRVNSASAKSIDCLSRQEGC